MNSSIERLCSLRVEDIMTRCVLTVLETDEMGEAAKMMVAANISGAPVVNEHGRCVGVISAHDFAKRQKAHEDMRDPLYLEASQQAGQSEQTAAVEAYSQDRVRAYMSTDLRTVSRDTTVLQASREMCRHHVHRLIVLDANDRPVGIASSLDVVAAMINAIEE